MAGRELGDRKLSKLFVLAAGFAMPGFESFKEFLGDEDLMNRNIQEVLEMMLEKEEGFGGDTPWGNKLDFGPDGKGPITGEWLYPETKK